MRARRPFLCHRVCLVKCPFSFPLVALQRHGKAHGWPGSFFFDTRSSGVILFSLPSFPFFRPRRDGARKKVKREMHERALLFFFFLSTVLALFFSSAAEIGEKEESGRGQKRRTRTSPFFPFPLAENGSSALFLFLFFFLPFSAIHQTPEKDIKES